MRSHIPYAHPKDSSPASAPLLVRVGLLMKARSATNAHLLLVEDNADQRNSLKLLLEMKGYVVSTAKNGLQALAQMRGNKPLPRLVITDLRMPVIDGWELRKKMLDDAELASVPVAVVSATPSSSTDPLDVVAYLQKPASLSSLLDVINKYLQPEP